MRARGLKRESDHVAVVILLSRPMRARGLKPYPVFDEVLEVAVAPHAGAWVETCESLKACTSVLSRPMRARGLKLEAALGGGAGAGGRAPCGRVG